MKSLFYTLACVAMLAAFASCEKNLEPYSEEQCRLNFYYLTWDGDVAMTDDIGEHMYSTYNQSDYSFYYEGQPERDTLWFKVSTMGFLSDQDRPIALKQIMQDTMENAEAGLHYVAFDAPDAAHLYVMPANADTVSIPVILLNDPSLEKKEVILCFGFDDNGTFAPGYDEFSYRVLRFTAEAVEPSAWIEGFFGTWGPVKHQLMIEWTGEAWDNDYINKIYEEDYPYLEYMNQWFHYKLEEENAKRVAGGLDVYREEDGTEITIPLYR